MKANMLDLQMELLFKKGEDRYIKGKEDLENTLAKTFNEAIANGSLVVEEAEELLEVLCESAVKARRIFNIITGQEEYNTDEEATETTNKIKNTFQESIDKGSDLEAEVREMIEAITLYETDKSIMMGYIVDNDLGIEVAMKVLKEAI